MADLTLRDRIGLAGKALFSSAPVQDVGTAIAQIFSQRRVPSRRTTEEFLKFYSKAPWLRAVVHRVAEDVSAVRWNVLAVRGERGFVRDRKAQRLGFRDRVPYLKQLAADDELEVIEEHPFRDMMERSDPTATGKIITGKMRRKLLSEHLDLAGDGFWLLERNEAGVPHMAWPLPPHWVTRLPTPEQLTFEVRFNAWQGEIPVSEVYWVSDADPHNPYGRGKGTAQAVADELETDEFAAKHTKQTFHNRARPDFIASFGAPLGERGGQPPDETQLKRLEHSWRHQHGGFWRAFKPHFTNREVKVHELGQTFEQLQLTELRQWQRDVVRQVFGVPAEILGEVGESNRATSFNSRMIYAENVLVSRLELIRDTLQDLAEREYDARIVIQYDSPLPDDREFQKEVTEVAPWAFLVDEIRGLAGHEPLEVGGDVHAVPFQISFHDSPGAAPGGRERANGNGRRKLPPRPKALPPGHKQGTSREFWRLVHRIADDLEADVRERFLEAVESVRADVDDDALMDAIRAGSPEAALRALGVDRLTEALGAEGAAIEEPIRQAFLRTAEAAAQDLAGILEVEVGFDASNPHVVQFVREHAAEMVVGVTEESEAAIRQAVARVFEEGASGFHTAEEIRDVLRQTIGLTPRMEQAVDNFLAELLDAGMDRDAAIQAAARYREAKLGQRADRIARNETIESAKRGQQEAWRQAEADGILDTDRTLREVIVTPDDRLCPICIPMDGQRRKPGEPYIHPVSGERFEEAHFHIQCRCAEGLVFTDDEE